MSPRWVGWKIACWALWAFGLGACSQTDPVIRAVVQLSPSLKATCFQLAVRSDGVEKLSSPIPKDTGQSVVFAIYRGRFPEQVQLVPQGLIGSKGCEGTLKLNEEGAPVTAQFESNGTPEVALTLGFGTTLFDEDRDGYRAAAQGGPDCDDSRPKVYPGAKEDCADQRDDDCNGLTDCADPVCANRACASGTCQASTCVGGLVELNCNNGLDDDGDGLIDCLDVNCEERTCAQDACHAGACTSGTCVGNAPVSCDSPPSECFASGAAATCDLARNGCVYPVKLGSPCNTNQGTCVGDGVCTPLFPYTPSNFSPPKYPDYSNKVSLSCGSPSVFVATDAELAKSGGFFRWCAGAEKPLVAKVTANGAPALLLAMRGFELLSPLRIVGDYPVIFAVLGDVDIFSTLDSGGDENEAGPGGGLPSTCTAGTSGGAVAGAEGPGGGGGGGGFAVAGPKGGLGGTGAAQGNGGSADTATGGVLLRPRGGCNGGEGGSSSIANSSGGYLAVAGGLGGKAGGGLQISASGWIRIAGGANPGVITVSGGPGKGGIPTQNKSGSGGGGGGSGGTLLLESRDLRISGRATANGGGGGEGAGGSTDAMGNDGQRSTLTADAAPGGSGGTTRGGDGGKGGTSAAPEAGGNGSDGSGGGGGGGGAAGKIRINVATSCTAAKLSGSVVSPPAVGCP